MKAILITVASSGIDQALTTKLTERKHNLLLVVRNAGNSELFKSKSGQSPLEFRAEFN